AARARRPPCFACPHAGGAAAGRAGRRSAGGRLPRARRPCRRDTGLGGTACGIRGGAAKHPFPLATGGGVARMLNEGDQVPDVTLTGMDGAPLSLAAFRGNKLVLYFYPKDDTSGCTREAQDFTGLAGDFEKAGT